ncbi:PREDICTED: uncharacterized protein LOC109216760 [Nicotiana attenuata]|uniref:uncharacterized protein LOC109216760 n=1 Tax=Nicotiana attenuata TaxID=49451 RepID=UPI000905ADB5|nr:PREDICTED: uncharacterized protein LOC109216760 [Nicotiana attenuata]
MYLQQRSKATWIHLGDDNTKYFFSVINHKKLQEAITQLHDKDGVLQTNPTDIARQVELIKPYTEKDVKVAMFQIDSNKSPGPDGYGSGFYKAAWDVIGDDITAAILEFFHNGKLLKQVNSTMISLIPKVTVPDNASQFRPISCCNVLYKCISKMICNRLRKAIDHLVVENQAAFVQGRSMIHNILICHDLLRHYNRKTSPRCLMKIDIRKAYDMVRWEFIEEALSGFGFPGKFVQLVMTCISSTMFTVKVNGEGHGYFAGKRGLGQGDPISPLLRYRICGKGYGSFTPGLEANLEKSNIFIAGVDEETNNALLARTGFSAGQLPIRYLGLPLSSKKWSDYAVLFSIYNFWGSVFILPQSVLKEIDRKCRDYLWGSSVEKRKIPLIAWDKLCIAKKYGRLNIKGCNKWNIASVGKLLWQLAEKKDMLWVKWVHGPLLDCSWYWRKLNSLKVEMMEWYHNGKYVLTASGKYSINGSYIALQGDLTRLPVAELIWTFIMQPKHRMILWLAAHGRLLTKDRLSKLHVPIQDIECCLCIDMVAETQDHMFQDCLWTTELRVAIQNWTNMIIPQGTVMQVLEKIKRKHGKFFKKEIAPAIWGALIYHTWKARNEKVKTPLESTELVRKKKKEFGKFPTAFPLLILLTSNTPPQAGGWRMLNTPSLLSRKLCCTDVSPLVKRSACCSFVETYCVAKNSVTGLRTCTPNSEKSPNNHTISKTADAMLRYSASALLRETVCYFLDLHEINESPSLTAYPLTDIRVIGHAAQSESQKAVSVSTFSLFNRTPIPGVPFRYLTTLKAASMCDLLGSCIN